MFQIFLSMAANTVVKAIYEDGDVRTWVVQAKNEANHKCYNAQVQFTIASGISLTGPALAGSSSINVEKGVYNPTTKIWYIGNMEANEIIESSFEFTVDDISLVDPDENYFEIKAVISSSCIDPDNCDNTAYLLLQPGGACKPVDLAAGFDEADCCQEDADLGAG